MNHNKKLFYSLAYLPHYYKSIFCSPVYYFKLTSEMFVLILYKILNQSIHLYQIFLDNKLQLTPVNVWPLLGLLNRPFIFVILFSYMIFTIYIKYTFILYWTTVFIVIFNYHYYNCRKKYKERYLSTLKL